MMVCTHPKRQRRIASIRAHAQLSFRVFEKRAELNREVLGEYLLTVPHKMDENIWRSRQQLEEILHLLEPAQLSDVEVRPLQMLWRELRRSADLVRFSGATDCRQGRVWRVL
jgi:hypothetical protein